MYIIINFDQFVDAFKRMGREDQFSRTALDLIYDYLNEYEDIELDIIAICCEFSEYTEEELIEEYGDLETVNNNHTVLNKDDTYVIVH